MKVKETVFKSMPSRMDFDIAVNDYYLDYTAADRKKFLITWLKEKGRTTEAAIIQKIEDWQVGCCGWTARMLSNGSLVPPSEKDYFEKEIIHLCGVRSNISPDLILSVENYLNNDERFK